MFSSELFGPSVASTARLNDNSLPLHQRIGGTAGSGLIDPSFVRQMSSYGTLPLSMTSLGHHRRHHPSGRTASNASSAVVSDDDVGESDGSFRQPMTSLSGVDSLAPVAAQGYHHVTPSMTAGAGQSNTASMTGGPIKTQATGHHALCNGSLPAGGLVANGNGIHR